VVGIVNAYKKLMTSDIIYRSKIGFEILIASVLLLGTVTTIVIMNSAWVAAVACVIIWLLLLNIYTKTYYKITTQNRLVVKNWFLESWDIEINDIVSITESNSAVSSLNRLEINYIGGQVSISPKNKKKFIGALRRVNSNIQGIMNSDQKNLV